jgi:hypothetical protein
MASSSSQHKRYLPEGHSPHHNFRGVYLKGIPSSQLQGFLPEVHYPNHNFRYIYLKDILLVTPSGMFT